MISIYLNSLYNMLYRHNPLVQIWQQWVKTYRSIRNYRRNMALAQQRINQLHYREQRVEAFVNATATHPKARFDVYR